MILTALSAWIMLQTALKVQLEVDVKHSVVNQLIVIGLRNLGWYAEFLLKIVLQFLLGKMAADLQDHAKISAYA